MGKFETPQCTQCMLPRYHSLTNLQEPGSAWYRDNVQRFDPHHIANANNPLLRRQEGDVTFNPEMTEPRTIYGNTNPVDVLNVLSDNCASSSCNNGPFTYTSTYVISLGEVATDLGDTVGEMTLQLDPTGQWDGSDPNQRGYYIDALKEIMKSKLDSKQQDWINGGADGTISEGSETIWTGAQYVNMNRFTNGALNGQLSVRITVVENDSGSCSDILGALSAAAGAINGIAGGFFGILGSTIC